MPVAPTYPGVYVQEISSGVRTIVGVSTSTAAFLGQAKKGPINKATRVLSFGDYERVFGGLDPASEMSYAVSQFFENGGSIAWIVRLAKDAVTAKRVLANADGDEVLQISAAGEGSDGNNIEIEVDHETDNPGTTFNLHATYAPPDDPGAKVHESFLNLTMNSKHHRYLQTVVNGASRLIKAERVADVANLPEGQAYSKQLSNAEGTALLDLASVLSDTCKEIRVVVDGGNPVNVTLNPAKLTGTPAEKLAAVCKAIADQVGDGCTCAGGRHGSEDADYRIVMTSPTAGSDASSVRVIPSPANDASSVLGFAPGDGRIYEDAAAAIRPAPVPNHGTLTGIEITTADAIHKGAFLISLDGGTKREVKLDVPAPAGSVGSKCATVAEKIQEVVRSLNSIDLAFRRFACARTETTGGAQFVLASGTRGSGSSVRVFEKTGDVLAKNLGLLSADIRVTEPADVKLASGFADSFGPEDALGVYLGSQPKRKGIYALDEVDIFNIMCLPAVTDSGVLAAAAKYCQDRRAFLIVDAPLNNTPAEMEQLISGPNLPKSEYAAIYYPWIRVRDPRANGVLRSCPPCGAIAGIYARTDLTRGVWKAPAGIETNLSGVVGLDYVLTDLEQGVLNPLGVNCIRMFPVISSVNWGARTLRGADQLTSEYKYVPIRRLALFIEESLFRGLKWVVFEPNDEPLWANIRMNVRAFLHDLFRKGAFAGATPQEAYFVRCDRETTTPNDQNLGIVNIWVGFAPLKPAEFVILTIQQIQEIGK